MKRDVRGSSRWNAVALTVLAALIVVGLIVLAFSRLDGLSGSEVTIEKSTLADVAVVLEPPRVTAEMPILAELLDSAASSGRVVHGIDSDNLRIEAYLDEVERLAEGSNRGQPLFEWKGEKYLIYRTVR